MKLIKLYGGGCQGSNCPAVYLDESDDIIVQGYILDKATRSELHDLPAAESAVRISAEVLVKAVERYLNR